MKLYLVNGFLGSGKTTAIQQACTALLQDKVKVAVITNDQGEDLVDTHFIKSFGVPAAEVPNGCFCCNYTQFAQAISTLQAAARPEVIFAESVGSCTDLIATIAKPLATFHPQLEIVISVFADAAFLTSMLDGRASFLNEEIRYIYKKQLAEADVLILNKTDLVPSSGLQQVCKIVQDEYGGKTILQQNSLNQQEVRHWLTVLQQFEQKEQRASLDLDYEVYAAGEAMLAWLNAAVEIETPANTAHETAASLAENIYRVLKDQQLVIGHLKFLIDDGFNQEKISYTMTGPAARATRVANGKASHVSLLINARVQALPAQVQEIITAAINKIQLKTGSRIVVQKWASFQPGYPMPTHRIAD